MTILEKVAQHGIWLLPSLQMCLAYSQALRPDIQERKDPNCLKTSPALNFWSRKWTWSKLKLKFSAKMVAVDGCLRGLSWMYFWGSHMVHKQSSQTKRWIFLFQCICGSWLESANQPWGCDGLSVLEERTGSPDQWRVRNEVAYIFVALNLQWKLSFFTRLLCFLKCSYK